MYEGGDPKTVARRWFEEVWNERRDDLIDELMSEKSYGHVEGGTVEGPSGFRQLQAMFFSALPDVRIDIEDIVSDGDRVAVRWRAVGTHAGDGFGFRATKQPIDVRGTSWMIVRDGQIVEGWDTWNLNGLLESLRAHAS